MISTKALTLTIVVLTLSDTVFAKIHRHHASSEFHFDWGWNSVALSELTSLGVDIVEETFEVWKLIENYPQNGFCHEGRACCSSLTWLNDTVSSHAVERLLHRRSSDFIRLHALGEGERTPGPAMWNIFTFFISEATISFSRLTPTLSPHSNRWINIALI